MTAISNDQAKIHIEAMLGELLRHDADENHPRILAMQKAIAALAPPSGEAVDAVVARACGVYDGAMIRLHGEESICNSDAMREVIEACAPKCMRLDCPCEMQIADCRYKSTTPQSAPVDGDAMVEQVLAYGFSHVYQLTDGERQKWRDYVHLDALDFDDIATMVRVGLQATTPPPASQERERVLELFLGRIFAAQRKNEDGKYLGWKIAGNGSLNEVVAEAREYLNCPLSPPSSAAEPKAERVIVDYNYNGDPVFADAAEQAKPDDCPFCGQPQAGELPPRCAAARTLGNETLVEVALQAAGRASLIDSEIHRSRYSECRTELLRRLAGWGTVDYPMVHLALNAQPYIDKNDAMRVWQLFKDGVDSETAMRAALVAALGADRG